tara:strand:- start:1842 stop:3209 length:1368 start_codon:yes stop_codon:yes gene_type:complete
MHVYLAYYKGGSYLYEQFDTANNKAREAFRSGDIAKAKKYQGEMIAILDDAIATEEKKGKKKSEAAIQRNKDARAFLKTSFSQMTGDIADFEIAMMDVQNNISNTEDLQSGITDVTTTYENLNAEIEKGENQLKKADEAVVNASNAYANFYKINAEGVLELTKAGEDYLEMLENQLSREEMIRSKRVEGVNKLSAAFKSASNTMKLDMLNLTETFNATFDSMKKLDATNAEAYAAAWKEASMTIAAALTESAIAIADNAISAAQSEAQSRIAALRETRAYEKASDDKKKEMERKETKEQRAAIAKNFKIKQSMAATGVVIDTAAAIMGIWKDFPKGDFGATAAIMTGVISALGAAQLSIINSQQPPKMAQGGLIGGRRHSQGGTLIEAEQGEFVMNRDAVSTLGIETMNRINRGRGGGLVNISFNGNVMSDDFIEEEAIPKIKEAIRRGADIGIG